MNHGCGPKQKIERILEFEIPNEEPENASTGVKYSETEKQLIKSLTGSVNSAIYKISYILKIFVKHDSLTQLGEGECVTLPIRIIEKPKFINVGESESFDLSGVIVAVNLPAQKYIERFVDWEKAWLKAAPPRVLTETQIK